MGTLKYVLSFFLISFKPISYISSAGRASNPEPVSGMWLHTTRSPALYRLSYRTGSSSFVFFFSQVKALDIWLFICIFFVFSAIVDCIADLRFLSMVEKESQIAGEEGVESDVPPVVDERARRISRPLNTDTAGTDNPYNVQFYGDNTPFQVRDTHTASARPRHIGNTYVVYYGRRNRLRLEAAHLHSHDVLLRIQYSDCNSKTVYDAPSVAFKWDCFTGIFLPIVDTRTHH